MKRTSPLKKLFEAPARALEESVEIIDADTKILINKEPFKLAEEYFNTLGPGLVTGAADDDPSGIATYSQVGATYGFQLLWLSLFSFPLMATIQEMCARIGVVTGRGLAANIRRHYSMEALWVVCALLFAANTLNIAADLGAMAASVQLLFPAVDMFFLVAVFALASMMLQIFTTYSRYAKFLKWMTLALFSYVFTAFMVGLDWGDALRHTILPSLSLQKDQLLLLCAVLGTTISPYLFFWQTAQEVEERHMAHDTRAKPREKTFLSTTLKSDIQKMRIDVWSGMFFSNIVMFFIVAACAATLYAHGVTSIKTAQDAALAIRPFGGQLTYILFTIGIIGTGLLAIPILAGSSAYCIAESFGWQRGLYQKLTNAYAFYGVIIVSMTIAVIANIAHLDPIKMLIYSAIGNGLVAPVVLFFIVRISSQLRHYKNTSFVSTIGWLTIGVMTISGIAAIASIFS